MYTSGQRGQTVNLASFVTSQVRILAMTTNLKNGDVAEWFKAAVSKTAIGQLIESSNPSISAIFKPCS